MFPECPLHFSCARNGRVIYRVCNDPANPHYRQCVKASTCRNCKPSLVAARPAPPSETRVKARVGYAREPNFSTTVPTEPTFVRRAMSYAEAVIEWTAAGRPERCKEEVERIFNDLCMPCKSFDEERQRCRRCGCRVTGGGFAFINKIKMATQNCPIGKW